MLVADGGAVGFKIADEPPNAEQLAFSKEIARRRRCQVMRWLAYQFSTIGARRWAGAWDRSWSATRIWAVGRLFKTIGGERVKVNFLIFYVIAQQYCEDSVTPG